ncbi:MAG TPA: hypothetical protein VMH26_03505 [Burkholderiales bacterium]|nr:hypothetical protein [Burkholderiales bacterium]
MSTSFYLEWPVAGGGRDPQPASGRACVQALTGRALDLRAGALALVGTHRGRLDTALRSLGPPLNGLDTQGPCVLARVFDRPDRIGHRVAPRFGPVRLVGEALRLSACGAPPS